MPAMPQTMLTILAVSPSQENVLGSIIMGNMRGQLDTEWNVRTTTRFASFLERQTKTHQQLDLKFSYDLCFITKLFFENIIDSDIYIGDLQAHKG